MSNEVNQISCPNCGENIDVNDIIYHQLKDELEKNFKAQLAEKEEDFALKRQELQNEKSELQKRENEFQEKLNEGIQSQLKVEKQKIEDTLKKKLTEENQGQFDLLQKELNEKSEQVKELNTYKAILAKVEREKQEIEERVKLEAEQQLTIQIKEARENIQKTADSKAQMQLSEKDHLINQLKEQLQSAQRKAEQGSMQLQGEVQELAIEEWLAEAFPLDSIEEIKKGERGADCLQIVNTRSQNNCGSIYYESKRTKSFQPTWIEKFKADIRNKNADIGVIITEAMPADMERLGLKEGIWICSYEEFKGLSVVLRDSIIKIKSAVVSQENKGDKMGMLYDFLTSNEFRLQIEAIVEGFTQMKSELDSEKRAMQSIWKKREKQIDKVLLNTNHMYSSIKGIAGNAIPKITLLELPAGQDSEEAE